ncbi:triacylglycerol lipase [Teratosphaeriaceae sp. CCFEE 6253]|nr:triacylglycerol lipase [Teratosphaeriaceae sp. CCFEE 6253]
MALVPTKLASFLRALWQFLLDVSLFWGLKLYRYLITPSKKQLLLETLQHAQSYEEWEAAALEVDRLLSNDLWRDTPHTKDYDFKLIAERSRQILEAEQLGDVWTICHMLRSTLVRNLGNITAAKLYNRAYAGTKTIIEDFTDELLVAIEYVVTYKAGMGDDILTNQMKLDLLHDARQSMGRSCLVLQGGSIFGLCHLGVVKALFLRNLLPRIIAGTATGALMAALVAVHTDEELVTFLSSENIDLSAFSAASERAASAASAPGAAQPSWLSTLTRRARRFIKYGYVLEVGVLEECVRANVGDLTFEEAYKHTKRVLNITVTTAGGGVPSLLNYLTAPNVLIWSAALASNAVDIRKSPIILRCKQPDGTIQPWDIPARAFQKPRRTYKTPSTDYERHTPLGRVAELFNVNHFVISQARPYIAPFLSPTSHHSASPRSSREPWSTFVMRILSMEIQHRLTQLAQVGLLTPGLRRLLLDESVPNSSWTLVPEVSVMDFARLLRNPTRKEIDYWISRGERSVWPAVTALRVRCTVETALDRGYQVVRRTKPFDSEWEDVEPERTPQTSMVPKRQRTKQRAASLGAG